jgi:NAD(P)-dependent dehydrogenase (short-subunit alcohol dehydrogenase family)
MTTFGVQTTAAEAIAGIDLGGNTVVITGASGGIGLETARAFAQAGAALVLGNRPGAKSDAAVAELRAGAPKASIEMLPLDLSSVASVRAFAAATVATCPRIELLINNAGIMATPFNRTTDGFESQFGTNHLGHFLLTSLLMPSVLAGDVARIVNVSSSGHHISNVHFDDLNYHQRTYSAWEAYGQSKTSNLLFTAELQRRFGGRGVHAIGLHPGLVGTDLMRYLSPEDQAWLTGRIKENNSFEKTPQQGASTTVVASTSTELTGGEYLEDCQVSKNRAAYANDPEAAARLWSMSEELLGVTFPAP